MPEINFKNLEKHLKTAKSIEQTILIYGDSYLCDIAFSSIQNFIFKGMEPGMNFDRLDGLSASGMADAVDFLMTRPFFTGPKTALLSDARIFDSKENSAGLLAKAKQAFEKKEIKKAAKIMLQYISESSKDEKKLTGANFHEILNVSADDEWIWETVKYCRENGITREENSNGLAMLENIISRGFPENHHLVITTDSVDKRKIAYKNFSGQALVINCQVPKGDRKADRDEQDSVFRERAAVTLAPLKKTLDPQAFVTLCEMTGYDLRIFTANIEMLADYAADRSRISVSDIKAVLTRTRQDPLYEFTNALASRNLESTLFFMRSILDSGAHPLQILAAMINQIRRLLVVKNFCESEKGNCWKNGMNYSEFQSQVMPSVTSADNELLETVAGWSIFSGTASSKKSAGPKTDLAIAKSGGSPYPVFLLFQKTAAFTKTGLLGFMKDLSILDVKMKTSGGDILLLVENFVIRFCKKL